MIHLIAAACLAAQGHSNPPAAPAPAPPDAASDWRSAEEGILAHHVQLTFSDRFIKAGESYFSPDDSKIIFQAVEAPRGDEAVEDFYAMFVADVVRDPATNRISGIDNIIRLSPRDSANTCGWFHPTKPGTVIFGSTLQHPTESTPPGYERASGRYRWMFPPEMKIVSCDLARADGTAATLETIVEMKNAYTAECSISPDGRHLLYCSLASNQGDLFATDLTTGETACIVSAQGYDGGPFFAPDGRRIAYRSDRRGDNHLQLFIADLAFNDAGSVIGIEREYQITDDEHVNWCPYWHPSGRFQVFATSRMGHRNYEVFIIDADPGDLPGSNGSVKYGTRLRRVTHAEGADVLPAFSSDGRTMIWTSQRHQPGQSQLWAAELVMELDEKAVGNGQ
jgi:Tol biopolymer transport system component